MTRSQGRKPRDQDQVLLPRETEHPNNMVEVIVIWGLPQPTAWSLGHQALSVNNRACLRADVSYFRVQQRK